MLFSKKDDYINLSEVARDYPKINEVELESKKHFLEQIEKLNNEKDAIPIFIKDNNEDLHIIASYTSNMEIAEGNKLVYLGKPMDVMDVKNDKSDEEEAPDNN